ncbi:MAG: thermonuclease family protein [Candidatus Omnitrophica bacterium]|nr:thermonuclease family protein [Candidatus Omnitrophota bacterium]
MTQVTDGDTFDAVIDLGFGFTTLQKLRLRGLDAPEIESAEGKEAKQFLEKIILSSPLLIKTVKSDKYDRYLADVWAGETYLNQELIDKGLAIPVRD